MKTCVAYPYALAVYNGGAKLVFLTDTDGRNYRGHGMARHWSKPDWSKLFKTKSYSSWTDADIIRAWREPPSAEAIRTAAKAFNRKKGA